MVLPKESATAAKSIAAAAAARGGEVEGVIRGAAQLPLLNLKNVTEIL